MGTVKIRNGTSKLMNRFSGLTTFKMADIRLLRSSRHTILFWYFMRKRRNKFSGIYSGGRKPLIDRFSSNVKRRKMFVQAVLVVVNQPRMKKVFGCVCDLMPGLTWC